MINYLRFDEKGIIEVLCMKCGVLVANRQMVNGVEQLVHMSHSKRHRVSLEDTTFADVILCMDCVGKVTPADYQDFEDAMKWGWKREHAWKFNESHKLEDRESYVRFKKRHKVLDDEIKLPKRVFDGMFEKKNIKSEGSKN